MKSYWKLQSKETREIVQVFEKDITCNKHLDEINEYKEKWIIRQITQVEFQYYYPKYGVGFDPAEKSK